MIRWRRNGKNRAYGVSQKEAGLMDNLIKEFLPWLLIYYKVDDLFIEDKVAAVKIVREKLKKTNYLIRKIQC
ncbi:hypothetical protein ACT7CS_12770 [Bacillus pacificus]